MVIGRRKRVEYCARCGDLCIFRLCFAQTMWFSHILLSGKVCGLRLWQKARHIPMREGEKGIGSLSLPLMTLLWEIELPRCTRRGCEVWHKQVVCLCQTAIVFDPNVFTARDERDPRVLIPEEVSRHARD